LNDTRAGAEAQNLAEINGADIADGVTAIRMIEQIEKISMQFNALRLGEWDALANGKIYIVLAWAPEDVATYVADIRTQVTRQGRRIMCAVWGEALKVRPKKAPATKTIAILRPPPICSHFCTRSPWPEFPQQAKDAT